MTTALLQTQLVEVPRGGCYSSDSNPDGTWNVRDVPCLVSFKEPYTRDWLEGAVNKARMQYAEQHVAPLHTHHHNFSGASVYETDDVEDAGLFMPTRVGEIFYQGKPVDTLFADFLKVPAPIYERMRSGELKYRSVEILDNRRQEISSCALLSHESPKLRLPMISIGRENGRQLYASESSEVDLTHCAVVVFRAQEESVTEKNAETPASPDGSKTPAAPAAPAATVGIEAYLATFGDKLISAIKDGNTATLSAICALGQKPEGKVSEPPTAETTKPAEQRLAAREAAGSSVEKGEIEILREKVAASEKSASISAKFVESLRQERETDKAVADATKRLGKIGVKVDETYEVALRERAVKGREVLEEHVATREKFGAAEPPAWGGDVRRAKPGKSAALAKYSARGPEILAKAEAAASDYRELPEVMREEISEDDFVHYQVDGSKRVSVNGATGERG